VLVFDHALSALQRAENSSILNLFRIKSWKSVSVLFSEPKIPQSMMSTRKVLYDICFSALQRAENSSIVSGIVDVVRYGEVSVLFSEPKIPQLFAPEPARARNQVSVLFSEPKIPQYLGSAPQSRARHRFSALQRAENSSIFRCSADPALADGFQCSSASRKFLNWRGQIERIEEAKEFQCSSASRKFLNRT